MKKYRILPWIPILNIVIIFAIAIKYVFSRDVENMIFVGVVWIGIMVALSITFPLWEFISKNTYPAIVDMVKLLILSICLSVGACIVTKRDERINR